MHKTTAVFVVGALVLAAGATAEPRDRTGTGNVGVDLIVAPSLGFGLPIRLTKNLTARAVFGFGSSATNGAAAWSAGGDLRYTLRPDADLSLYASVQASYLRSGATMGPAGTGTAASPVLSASSGNAGLYGAGLGLQRRLGRRTSAYAELRYGRVTSTGVYDSWGTWGAGGRNQVSLALGATFGLR